MKSNLLTPLLFVIILGSANAQDWNTIPKQEQELGHINWSRSFEQTIERAKKIDKPVFILFQEVPGCSTCKNYGNHILTHPHIVEAIETYFVPLVIFNNKKGDDFKVLQKFNEPSWNNPVVRIIDHSTEKDIVKRLNGRYDMASLISTINAGILADNKLIPEYLNLLEKEHVAKDIRETHLAMFCFWSGEKHLGTLEGVIGTKAGFMNGVEVVKVQYDAAALKENDLLNYAAQKNCADGIFTNDQREVKAAKKIGISTKNKGQFRPDGQPKYYIYNTKFRYLPMTKLQALKVNTAISEQRSPLRFLSPRQLELIDQLKFNKRGFKPAIDIEFTKAWHAALGAQKR